MFFISPHHICINKYAYSCRINQIHLGGGGGGGGEKKKFFKKIKKTNFFIGVGGGVHGEKKRDV